MIKGMALGVLAALTTAAAPASLPRPGVYSDVCVSRETGDQDGYELQLLTAAATPTVRLKVCEGGCWEEPVRDVAYGPGEVRFVAVEESFDGDGKLVESRPERFLATFGKGAVVLRSLDHKGARPGRLRRQKRPVDPTPMKPNTAEGKDDPWPPPVRRC